MTNKNNDNDKNGIRDRGTVWIVRIIQFSHHHTITINTSSLNSVTVGKIINAFWLDLCHKLESDIFYIEQMNKIDNDQNTFTNNAALHGNLLIFIKKWEVLCIVAFAAVVVVVVVVMGDSFSRLIFSSRWSTRRSRRTWRPPQLPLPPLGRHLHLDPNLLAVQPCWETLLAKSNVFFSFSFQVLGSTFSLVVELMLGQEVQSLLSQLKPGPRLLPAIAALTDLGNLFDPKLVFNPRARNHFFNFYSSSALEGNNLCQLLVGSGESPPSLLSCLPSPTLTPPSPSPPSGAFDASAVWGKVSLPCLRWTGSP